MNTGDLVWLEQVWNVYQRFVMVTRGLTWLPEVWNGYQRFGMVITVLTWLSSNTQGLKSQAWYRLTTVKQRNKDKSITVITV